MKYHYEKPQTWTTKHASVYKCDHGVYTYCTLYRRGELGLAVVQQRWNPEMKVSWWGAIDPWLIDDIYNQPFFESFFFENADENENGIFPTVSVRKIMWALRMKPLPKEPWEQQLQLLY